MHIVLQVLNQWNGRPVTCVSALLLLKLQPVLDLPEPAHIVMRQHHSFGVSRCPTCIQHIAAHARLLLDHPLDHDPVVYVFTQLHELSPVVNLNLLLLLLRVDAALTSEIGAKFTEDDSDLYSNFQVLLLVLKVLLLESFPAVAHDHLRVAVSHLLQAGFRRIGNVLVREYAVRTDGTHDCKDVLRRVVPLDTHTGSLRDAKGNH